MPPVETIWPGALRGLEPVLLRALVLDVHQSVVDQLEELTRNRAQVILANSKTRGNLRGEQGFNSHYHLIIKEFQNNKKRTFSQCEPT